MKCWAKSVSECCNTQSREHYVTQGLFSGKILLVHNAPFLSEKSALIGKSSLTKKCLCKKHNELLSPYDDESILFSKALEYASELHFKRKNSKQNKFSIHNKSINNDKFCRWLIKTYLGFVAFFEHQSNISIDTLAQLVYSETPITNHVELKMHMVVNEEFTTKQEVSIAPLIKNSENIGIEVVLYGVRVHAIFSEKPIRKQKPLKIEFYEHKQGKSCVIKFK